MTGRLGYLLPSLIVCIIAAFFTWLTLRNVANLRSSDDLGALGYLGGTVTWGVVSTIAWMIAIGLLAGGLVARSRRKGA